MTILQALNLFTESDLEEIGRSFFLLTQQCPDNALTFAAAKGKGKPKQCSKGFACGAGCVAKTKTCANPLKGQAKNYAGWLQIQINAGAKLSKSQQEDADVAGIKPKPPAQKTQKKSKPPSPTLKATEFNPHAVKDLGLETYRQHRIDREFLKYQDNAASPWNQGFDEWKATTEVSAPNKTKYSIEVLGALNAGHVPSEEALAQVKLTKAQEKQLAVNQAALAETRKRYETLQAAIDYPLLTDVEAKGYKPFMSTAEANQYVEGSYAGGLSFYHGNTKDIADNMSGEGVKPDLNKRGLYGQGAYFATSKEVSEYFAQTSGEVMGANTSVLEFKAKVKNPYVMDSENVENIGRNFGGDQDNGIDSTAVTEFLRAKGHDSIYLSDKGYLITFDGRQSVVTAKEDVTTERTANIKNFWSDKLSIADQDAVSMASDSFKGLAPAKLTEATRYEVNEDDFGF